MEQEIKVGKQCLISSHQSVFDMLKAEFKNWNNDLATYKNDDEGIHLSYMGKWIGHFECYIGWVNSTTWFVKVQFVPTPDFWILKTLTNGK